MHYYLAPYEWRDLGGFEGYCAPEGVVGSVDLRTLGQQSGEGGGVGFFASPDPIAGLTAIASGDLREINTTAAMRSAWQSLTGVRTQGTKLIDLLWDHLTEGADPQGDAACCPLMPTSTLDLELHLGGHSLIKSAKLDKASRHWNKVKAVETLGTERLFKALERGEIAEEIIRKNLDSQGRKYKVDKPQDDFTPAKRTKLERLRHNTVKTESWPTNGAITSGQNNTWSLFATSSNLAVSSGELIGTGGGSTPADCGRLDYDFATDHYAQLVFKTITGGDALQAIHVGGRKDSSSTVTFYAVQWVSSLNLWRTYKDVASVQTVIGTNTSAGASTNDVLKIDISGSTITRYRNGSSQNGTTDTAISSGTRAMAGKFGATTRTFTSDSFEAGDATVDGHPAIRRMGGVAFAHGGYQPHSAVRVW